MPGNVWIVPSIGDGKSTTYGDVIEGDAYVMSGAHQAIVALAKGKTALQTESWPIEGERRLTELRVTERGKASAVHVFFEETDQGLVLWGAQNRQTNMGKMRSEVLDRARAAPVVPPHHVLVVTSRLLGRPEVALVDAWPGDSEFSAVDDTVRFGGSREYDKPQRTEKVVSNVVVDALEQWLAAKAVTAKAAEDGRVVMGWSESADMATVGMLAKKHLVDVHASLGRSMASAPTLDVLRNMNDLGVAEVQRVRALREKARDDVPRAFARARAAEEQSLRAFGKADPDWTGQVGDNMFGGYFDAGNPDQLETVAAATARLVKMDTPFESDLAEIAMRTMPGKSDTGHFFG